jgi:CheY-like chemotaxis protein
MRVLIADDQKSVGTSLAQLVCLCQHEVVEVVGSGLEAIHAYERHQPDVVLMDYWMPKLNGATACRNILARHPNARVILISGSSPSDLVNSGAFAVLPKPVRLERLYAAFYELVQPPRTDMNGVTVTLEPTMPTTGPNGHVIAPDTIPLGPVVTKDLAVESTTQPRARELSPL